MAKLNTGHRLSTHGSAFRRHDSLNTPKIKQIHQQVNILGIQFLYEAMCYRL
jgi:hypothetical protein